MVTEIAAKRFQEERDILPEGIKLVAQRPARAQQIAADLAIDLDHKRGLGFPIGVIGGKKIGEQLSIFVDRIDRLAQKSGIAAKLADSIAIRVAIAANDERLLVLDGHEVRR